MAKLGEASTFQALIDLIKSKLGRAAYKNTPTSGNAGTDEVVLGSDSRLSDNRTPTSHTHTKTDISDFPSSMPASDVYSWAKESTKPSYNYSEIGNTPTLGSAAGKDIPVSGNAGTDEVVMGSDSRLSDSRTPTSHTHTTSDISDFPSIPTFGSAATRNVPASGDAANGEVVLGSDSRLTDSRTPTSHSHTVSDITDFPTIPSGGTTLYEKQVSNTITSLGDMNLDLSNADGKNVHVLSAKCISHGEGSGVNVIALPFTIEYNNMWFALLIREDTMRPITSYATLKVLYTKNI